MLSETISIGTYTGIVRNLLSCFCACCALTCAAVLDLSGGAGTLLSIEDSPIDAGGLKHACIVE